MANPPRTHTTKVILRPGSIERWINLPADWEPSTRVAVVDLTALPPGLTPNLGGDGTYWGMLADVIQAGYEWRCNDTHSWMPPTIGDRTGPHSRDIVQTRPAPQPPTERIPWHQAVGRRAPGGDTIVQVSAWTSGSQAYFLAKQGATQYEVSDGMVEVLVDSDDNQETSEPRMMQSIWPKQVGGDTVAMEDVMPDDRPGGGDR